MSQGYNQEEGIDYEKISSLIAKLEAIRLLLANECRERYPHSYGQWDSLAPTCR